MKTIIRTSALLLAWVLPAVAAGGSDAEGSGLLLYLFLGFVALIVVFQFTPGLVLFATMVKELFSRAPKKSTDAVTGPSKGR